MCGLYVCVCVECVCAGTLFAKLSTNRAAACEARLKAKTVATRGIEKERREGDRAEREGEKREGAVAKAEPRVEAAETDARTQGVILFLFAALGFKCGQVVWLRQGGRRRE